MTNEKFRTIYRLGRELNANLDIEPIATLPEIAAELGISRQGVQDIVIRALGKIALAFRGSGTREDWV
jgi:hypothetical protein